MPNKRIQLFLLPFAGGSASSYKRLVSFLDARIECIPVEYPGRGTRAKEPLAASFGELLCDAAQYCLERRDPELPFSVFGYSMGSILAYELVERKRIPGGLKHLFLSAEISPKDRSIELRKVQNPTEERILHHAIKLGGLDVSNLEDRRFAEIFIKPMLSDYRLFFSYEFGAERRPICADTTVFYCEQDTGLAKVQKWEELIQGSFDYHEFGSNHFFIKQYAFEMADVINQRLKKYLTGDKDDL